MNKLISFVLIFFSSCGWACAPGWHFSQVMKTYNCGPIMYPAQSALTFGDRKMTDLPKVGGLRFALLTGLVLENELKVRWIDDIYRERQFIMSLQSRFVSLKEQNTFDVDNIEKTFRRERLSWSDANYSIYRTIKELATRENQAEDVFGPSYTSKAVLVDFLIDPSLARKNNVIEYYKAQKIRISYFVSQIATKDKIPNPPLTVLVPGGAGENFWRTDWSKRNATCDIKNLEIMLGVSDKALAAIEKWSADDAKFLSLFDILEQEGRKAGHTFDISDRQNLRHLIRFKDVLPPSLLQVYEEVKALAAINGFWGRTPDITSSFEMEDFEKEFTYRDPMNSLARPLSVIQDMKNNLDRVSSQQKKMYYDNLKSVLQAATLQLKFEIRRMKRLSEGDEATACMMTDLYGWGTL